MKEELLTEAQAAAYLRVGERQLRKMARRGHVKLQQTEHGKAYRKSDLRILEGLLTEGVPTGFVEAKQLVSEVRALTNELNRIKFVVGLDLPKLGTDRDSVISLLLKAEDALREQPTKEPEELMVWARNLQALTEAHLEAITRYTDQKEPWRAFLNLGHKLCAAQDIQVTNESAELTLIYALLNASLRNARRVAYFHVRDLYGKAYARKLFPQAEGCPHEDVIAMAFANLNWELPSMH